jgi:hypothetical protein
MHYHISLPISKMIYIVAVASAAPIAATAMSAEIHWDISSILVALITGTFGTIQIYMLSRLHTMVNSQQSELNRISQLAERDAAFSKGLIAGSLGEREKQVIVKEKE